MPAAAVGHLHDCEQIVKKHGISLAVLAVPSHAAQEAADRLVAAGVTSILNFAPTVVAVPSGVSVRNVDLLSELQILAFYEQRRLAERSGRDALAAPTSRSAPTAS